MEICPECASELQANSAECPECGYQLSDNVHVSRDEWDVLWIVFMLVGVGGTAINYWFWYSPILANLGGFVLFLIGAVNLWKKHAGKRLKDHEDAGFFKKSVFFTGILVIYFGSGFSWVIISSKMIFSPSCNVLQNEAAAAEITEYVPVPISRSDGAKFVVISTKFFPGTTLIGRALLTDEEYEQMMNTGGNKLEIDGIKFGVSINRNCNEYDRNRIKQRYFSISFCYNQYPEWWFSKHRKPDDCLYLSANRRTISLYFVRNADHNMVYFLFFSG